MIIEEDGFIYEVVTCETCQGMGERDCECPLCKGQDPDFDCLCEGAGHFFQLCPDCHGQGEILIEKNIKEK
jgi:DnaJ-class molecular chaperone